MEEPASKTAMRLSRRAALAALIWPALASARTGRDAPRDAVDVRRFGAVGDGVADDTEALIRAHADGRPVFYPRPPRFYRTTRVVPLSSSAFGEMSEIRIAQDGTTSRCVFRITENQRPVAIEGFVLDGGYSGGSQSEFSAGVVMLGARDVSVAGNVIKNQYGDCVYIGSSRDAVTSRNILIRDNVLLNPRRCNVAVVCGENVSILDNRMEKSVDYVSAIDLEPNLNNFDRVTGVTVKGNAFNAIGVFLLAGVNTGRPNTGLVVTRNRGRAKQFFHITDTAMIRGALVSENSFTANHPDGGMFLWVNARDMTVVGNIDNTPCRPWAYRSVSLWDTRASFRKNRFCGPLPAPSLTP